MKINRLIYLVLMIGSGVFASYYGGNISYALFYLSILIPIISFLYTIYVYSRFKIYQSMGSNRIVKGDWTQYTMVITNEDYITFRNIKVNFLSDKSSIEAADRIIEYSLIPSESDGLETRIKCNYRGEYVVGVDSVEITDFLYLFQITYPLKTRLRVLVLPRIVQLERLSIALKEHDEKNPLSSSNMVEESLDTEIRKYFPGDEGKRIHWKASARMHELISRKYQYIPKAEIAIFMDLAKINEDELKVIKAEDKIIESVLAITNYYTLRRIKSSITYDMNGKKLVTITSKSDFNAFYKDCAKIYFKSDIPVHILLQDGMQNGREDLYLIVVTHSLTKELYLTLVQAVSNGHPVSVLFISDDVSEDTTRIVDGMKQTGVRIIQIMSEDEISSVLSDGGEGGSSC